MSFKDAFDATKAMAVKLIEEGQWAGVSAASDAWTTLASKHAKGEKIETLASARDAISRIRAGILAKYPDADPSSPAALSGELRVVIRLLSEVSAAALKDDDFAAFIDRTKSMLREIEAKPVSTGELARRLGVRAETVARRLPRLRDLGVVESWPSGRETLNILTPHGRALIQDVRGSHPARNVPEATPNLLNAILVNSKPAYGNSNDVERVQSTEPCVTAPAAGSAKSAELIKKMTPVDDMQRGSLVSNVADLTGIVIRQARSDLLAERVL